MSPEMKRGNQRSSETGKTGMLHQGSKDGAGKLLDWNH